MNTPNETNPAPQNPDTGPDNEVMVLTITEEQQRRAWPLACSVLDLAVITKGRQAGITDAIALVSALCSAMADYTGPEAMTQLLRQLADTSEKGTPAWHEQRAKRAMEIARAGEAYAKTQADAAIEKAKEAVARDKKLH